MKRNLVGFCAAFALGGSAVLDECVAQVFHRGDVNDDGRITISDNVFVQDYLFKGGTEPPCMDTADVNHDGSINITDGIFVLNYLFHGGFPPPAPGPGEPCGLDPRGESLGCVSYQSCTTEREPQTIDSSLEVVFAENHSSVLTYEGSTQGREFGVEIVTETRTERISAWSYAVAHDPGVLELREESVSHENTIVEIVESRNNGFYETLAVPGGFVQAVQLSFTNLIELPLERNVLSRANYRLLANVDRTRIEFVDEEIGEPGSPPTALCFTVDGQDTKPAAIVNGEVICENCAGFVRGDANDDGEVDVADAVVILLHLFRQENLNRPISCEDAADVDGSTSLQVTDAVSLLFHLFLRGPPPPPPYPNCVSGAVSNSLSCESYLSCR